MKIVIIFITLVVLIIIIRYWLRKPIKHLIKSINELKKYFNGLLDQCTDGSVLIIEHRDTKKFIQFTKRSIEKGKVGFHFGFPDAPWSREFFIMIQKEFEQNKIEYIINPTNDSVVRRFLEINNIKNSSEALTIAKLVLKVMDLSYDDWFIVKYDANLKKDALEKSVQRMMNERKR